MQPVVIRRSWTQVALALVVSGLTAMVIGVISWGMLSLSTALPDTACAIMSIAGAGCFWLWLVHHLSPTKPALIIDARGIVDQVSVHEVGLIPWAEIRGVEIILRHANLGSPKVLAIAVRDLEALTAPLGLIARLMMFFEKRLSGSVIEIPQMSLRTPVEEVLSALQQHWRQMPPSGMAVAPECAALRTESTNGPDQLRHDPAGWRSHGCTVAAVLLLSLAFYGWYAWYFPNAALTAVAALLAVALAIAGTYRLRLWTMSTLVYCACVTLGALLLWPVVWFVVLQGGAAMVTHLLGARSAEVAVIGVKKKTQHSEFFCEYQLGLVGYTSVLKETLCVNRALWNQVVVGQSVEIVIRKDVLGTRIFAIRLPPKS